MGDSETILVWKKLYHIISGGNTTVTTDIVEDILHLCKKKLVLGFLEYTPYTRKSFQLWKEQSGLKDIVEDDEMCNFFHLLSRELNLDVNIAWTIMCNFLMFEYFGKIDELKSIIKYDTNVRYLIDNVWHFYSADRMFLLKSLRHIFENIPNTEYKFYEQFNQFLKSVDITVLWKNLMKILADLISELDKDRAQMVSSEALKRWVHRNNREQVEVVMLMIHVTQFLKIEGSELEDVLMLFLKHGFTRHLLYQESNVISRPKDLWDIKCAEIGCFLAIMERYWQDPGKAKMLSKNAEKNLERFQTQGDNSVVLFAWAVLKTSIADTQDVMEYCNNIMDELIQKRVFRSLHNLLIAKIFDKCKSGDIVVEGVFRLMAEFKKICADYTYFHEQDGVCEVTAELLRRKGSDVLNYLEPIFQLSMDAFPFVFNPFLEMCKSMLVSPKHYDNIMALLKEIPSFLAETPWNHPGDSYNLTEMQQLFIDSDVLVIPAGSRVEKFRYQGMEFTRFIHPFNFFFLLEQFTKSLSVITFEVGKSWYCYDNLTELVHIGFKFIIHILKHYKGNYHSDIILKRLIQRLDIIALQFCEGPTKNFNFIKLFFEISVTLIVHDLSEFSEVFDPIIRRRFFPQVTHYNRSIKKGLNHMHYESILFSSLKEEESMGDHTLLLEYLKLIQYTVEKDIYHQEVQLAGMLYILNVVFPLHQQWLYEDDSQLTTICKFCITIFVKVLQKTEVNESHISNEVVSMCQKAFMFEELLMSSYLSIFYKDKFYIQSLMEQESNWINGPVLDQIENIRLQMVLLLLIYKIRSTIPTSTKCTIDNKISAVTRAISAHMVNPYNATLRLLSYRFLEILSRAENIPMMALLGLDYDQVQGLFLDKLRDAMEDDNVKMQILDLISTCIFSQHGITAALFNVSRSRKWHSDFKEKRIEGDSVTDFMIDYLQNIKKSHEYLKSPLQVAILRVMSNLWLGGKRHLVKDIIALDAFWPLLTDPLFQEYNHLPYIYGYIFKILSTQLGDVTGDRKQFLATVEKFLTDDTLMELWQKYMIKMLESSSDITEKKFLVKSWLEFMVMAEKDNDLKKFLSNKTKFLFITMCLDGLQFSFANENCMDTWINMCLTFVTSWGLNFKNKEAVIAEKIIVMYNAIKLHYNRLSPQTRSTILSIILIVLKHLRKYFEGNTMKFLDLLEEIGPLVDHEYTVFQDEVWTTVTEGGAAMKELMLPWMICIYIANELLTIKNADECCLWFSYRNYLPNLIKCICNLINKPQTLPFTKIALHSLRLYVESPLAFDFLNINMTNFYDSIERPLTALFVGQSNKINVEELEEAWITCTFLLKFNQAFLKKFQYTALPTCYIYIKLQEQIIHQIMTIPECTVALKALDLLLNSLVFFDDILTNWQTEWHRESSNTYLLILNRVKKVINSCLYIILRPKNIVLYVLDDYHRLNQKDRVPMSLMVIIMNRLITIIGLCFSMLYRANPSLIGLMGVITKDKTMILVQNDFSVPKFELPIPYELTYSKLLCLAHFMCKTLDALSLAQSQSKEDLNEKQYNNYIGLVEHQDLGYHFPGQKLGAYLRYAMYKYSGLADPWIHKLDRRCVKKSFELLMTFLAQQVFLYIRTTDVESLSYFKKNLASELQFFYEHVKKHTSMSLADHMTASARTITTFKADMDILKRYLLYCQVTNQYFDAADNNFGVVIVHWFTKICQVH